MIVYSRYFVSSPLYFHFFFRSYTFTVLIFWPFYHPTNIWFANIAKNITRNYHLPRYAIQHPKNLNRQTKAKKEHRQTKQKTDCTSPEGSWKKEWKWKWSYLLVLIVMTISKGNNKKRRMSKWQTNRTSGYALGIQFKGGRVIW